jgi:integrase
MGRKSDGIRPWYDKKIDKWHIIDPEPGAPKYRWSLGFGGEKSGASAAHKAADKYEQEKRAGGRLSMTRQATSDVTVADLIAFYIDRRIENFVPDDDYPNELVRQEDVVGRLAVLLEFFEDLPLDSVSRVRCLDFGKFVHTREIARAKALYDRRQEIYQEKLAVFQKKADARQKFITELAERRHSRVLPPLRSRPPLPLEPFNPATIPYRRSAARRYLEELSAAVTFAVTYEFIRHKIHIHLPPKYEPRKHAFTLSDVRRMIRAAWKHKGMGWINGKPVKDLPTRRHLARFAFLAITTGSRKDKIERVSFRNEGDRPWINLWQEAHPETGDLVWKGRYHRLGEDEIEHKTKQAPSLPIPDIVVKRLIRWRDQGLIYPCAYPYHRQGKEEPGNVKDGMKAIFEETFGDETEAVIHSFRHSAATWLCADKELPLPSIAAYLGMSTETLVKTYAKHREEDLQKIAEAISDPDRKGKGVHSVRLRETNPKQGKNARQKSTEIGRMEINEGRRESTRSNKSPEKSKRGAA